MDENSVVISAQALQRMPYYLQYLKQLRGDGVEVIAAPAIAKMMNLNEIQVRKDFAAVSTTKGKPKTGFVIEELIENMEDHMGYHNTNEAIIVGAGSLGRALMSYKGFDEYGIQIVCAFDNDKTVVGSEICGKRVLPAEKLSEMCKRMKIHIGIIAVPASQAQKVCDQLVSGGVYGIWNFAPVHLSAPEHILVQNENMAASLAMLSKHLQEKQKSH